MNDGYEPLPGASYFMGSQRLVLAPNHSIRKLNFAGLLYVR